MAIPEIVINLIWNARYEREPGNAWLRQVVVEEFAESKVLGRSRRQ